VTEPSRSVFLSYASQDAEAARRIYDALRTAGMEVWFDQSELRGGDAWDRQIRKQIHDCALLIPIISVNTQARAEGYFRLEWKLAVERTHLMSERVAFLVPVVIDATRDQDADVPSAFRGVQWTRLPGGNTSTSFCQRVAALLAGTENSGPTSLRRAPGPHAAPERTAYLGIAIGLVAVVVLAAVALKPWQLVTQRPASVPVASRAVESRTVAVPEKSIAVLPFVNMSSDKEQDYFSDGLTEEMIDLLGREPDLRVPARTSSFYFKGKNETVANIAQQLKVAYVLEGSVREAGKRLRITAQLIRADNGYHLWSQAYDREDTDVFAVQDDIAKAVVSALKVKLATGVPVTGSRGTTNTEAYNEYLLGRQIARRGNLEGFRQAVAAFSKAIALDPNYAAAYAGLAAAEAQLADDTGDRTGGIERAGHYVDKAIALAPADANGYAERSFIRAAWQWDWSGAQADIEKALILDPRNSDVQHRYAQFLVTVDRMPEAIAAQEKVTELDPLSNNAWDSLAAFYLDIGDYASAEAAIARAIEIDARYAWGQYDLGLLRLLQGKGQEAREAFRKVDEEPIRLSGIAMAEHTLGHVKKSQQALDELIAKEAQNAAYEIAEVFAWRGESNKAFEWLERAYKQREGALSQIKTDPILKSLHTDPRYKAFLRKTNLPE
jgi:TolB-like protein/Flp pilus assembly protein TadD